MVSPVVCIDKVNTYIINLRKDIVRWCRDRFVESHLDDDVARIWFEWHPGFLNYLWASSLEVNEQMLVS